MAANRNQGPNGKKPTGRKRSSRSAKSGALTTTALVAAVGGETSKTKRHVSSAAGQALNYRTGTQSVTKPRAVRAVKALSASAPYSVAEEESVVRLARNAEASRSNPGEDLTGLSDQEFLARLLG